MNICKDKETTHQLLKYQKPEQVYQFFDSGGIVLP